MKRLKGKRRRRGLGSALGMSDTSTGLLLFGGVVAVMVAGWWALARA